MKTTIVHFIWFKNFIPVPPLLHIKYLQKHHIVCLGRKISKVKLCTEFLTPI